MVIPTSDIATRVSLYLQKQRKRSNSPDRKLHATVGLAEYGGVSCVILEIEGTPSKGMALVRPSNAGGWEGGLDKNGPHSEWAHHQMMVLILGPEAKMVEIKPRGRNRDIWWDIYALAIQVSKKEKP